MSRCSRNPKICGKTKKTGRTLRKVRTRREIFYGRSIDIAEVIKRWLGGANLKIWFKSEKPIRLAAPLSPLESQLLTQIAISGKYGGRYFVPFKWNDLSLYDIAIANIEFAQTPDPIQSYLNYKNRELIVDHYVFTMKGRAKLDKAIGIYRILRDVNLIHFIAERAYQVTSGREMFMNRKISRPQAFLDIIEMGVAGGAKVRVHSRGIVGNRNTSRLSPQKMRSKLRISASTYTRAKRSWGRHNRTFMNKQLAKILRDKQHPLNFLVDRKRRIWKSRSHLSTRPTVQAGHGTSKRGGLPEELGLEDSWFNQVSNHRGETQGAVFSKVFIDIKGVPVEMRTAKMWESIGELPKGTVAKSPIVPGWKPK